MIDISSWAFDNRKLINFLVAVLMIGGIYASYDMSKLEDPEIKVKNAMVVCTYLGASAHQTELEVTDVLEKNIRTMGNIGHIESHSYNDLSIIEVELLTTVPDDQVEQCWDMLRRKVNNAVAQLPQGASLPMVRDDFGNVYGMFYAMTGDGMPMPDMQRYAELLQREIVDIDGADRVELYGVGSECIDISLLQDRMAALGVLPVEVLNTLSGQMKTSYAGYFDNGDRRIRLTVSDQYSTPEQIGAMLIRGHSDDQLRLRDIAKVERTMAQPQRNSLYRDGQAAIGLLVAPTSGSDIVKVGARVEQTISRLQAERLPTGVVCHKVFNQPDRVGDSLGTFILNLIESVVIVVLILMFAMGFKSGVIIGASLVVTVMGSFLFLLSFDGTMQRVSLASFVLAMGMLVDNAIVIIDGILVDLKAGKPRREALTAIGRQTAMPLLGATIIAILAFLPIFLSPDSAGVYVRDLFIVLAVSLLLSWVLALVHVPLMADSILKPDVRKSGNEATDLYNGKVYQILAKILRFGLRHRLTFIGVALLLLILSGIGYFHMKQGFFPDMQYDQLYMEYKLPEGTRQTRVEKDLGEIAAYLQSRPDVSHITTSIGGTPGRYNLVRSIALPSLSYGELIIDFTSPEALVGAIDDIQAELTARYPDAYVKFKRYNLMFKKYPIEAQFCGPDPAVLHSLADSARQIMNHSPQVCLITTDWEPRVPVLRVDYDQQAARACGISRGDISMSLMTAAGGIPITTLHEGNRSIPINLKCTKVDGKPIDDFSSVQVSSTLPQVSRILNKETLLKLRGGTLSTDDLASELLSSTPLRQAAHSVSVDWEDPVVPRYNGQRSQRVQCSPVAGVETEAARRSIAAEIEKIHLPEGYTLSWQGEKSASDQSMKYLFKNFPLAIILMIAILIMLFKGYRKTALIFCCIPFIVVGVVAFMLLTGKVFNFVAIVGVLGLIGMLIKNGIVLMDEIGLQLSTGADPSEALIVSSQSRLRPVMMASLTTILGMIPLLPDAMFGSLAATIMGGLLFATLITLLLLPVLYALFYKIKTK